MVALLALTTTIGTIEIIRSSVVVLVIIAVVIPVVASIVPVRVVLPVALAIVTIVVAVVRIVVVAVVVLVVSARVRGSVLLCMGCGRFLNLLATHLVHNTVAASLAAAAAESTSIVEVALLLAPLLGFRLVSDSLLTSLHRFAAHLLNSAHFFELKLLISFFKIEPLAVFVLAARLNLILRRLLLQRDGAFNFAHLLDLALERHVGFLQILNVLMVHLVHVDGLQHGMIL